MSMARSAKICATLKGAALTLMFLLALCVYGKPPATEYEVKSAYLLNFGKFIQWPATAIPPAAQNFSICVLGDDPFGQTLDATVRDEKIAGKPVAARRISRIQEANGCQVLFISRSEEGRARKVLQQLNKTGVLTVSDMPGFLDHDGMIQFTLVGNRIRFEVNLDAVQDGGLTLSSELLKVASFVKGKSRAGRP